MNILGMGPMEVLLIVVLALIVFGPARLPEIMAQVGKAIGDFRRTTSELSNEFNRTIQAELQETRAVVEDTKATFTDARTSLYDAHASVSSAITGSAIAGTPAPVRTAVPAEALPSPNGTSGEHASNGTATVQPAAPAVADKTPWSWETAAPPAKVAAENGATSSAPSSGQETPDAASATPLTPRQRIAPDELLPPY